MTIATILGSRAADIVSIDAGAKVGDAVRLLAERRIGALPVLDGTSVIGIFSERDVLYCIAREGGDFLERSVGDVMTAPAVTVSPDTALLAALALMTKRRIRHLPVVENGAMIGFVSIGDLVKTRIDRIEAEADAMRQYISGN